MKTVEPSISESVADPLLAGYDSPSGRFDEVGPTDAVRPNWTALLQALEELGAAELTRRWNDARRIIRENGVTYNIHGDGRGADRPWALDPIPFPIAEREWNWLEAALVQRATLLDRMLADLYGPQRLLTEGLIPPELVFGSPGFLRPVFGVSVPRDRRLLLYAADLGRDTDGGFRVLRDRTQSPSGAGYALENRIVMSRAFPDVFRDCRVQRLALYFRSMRETLAAISPRTRESPRIVLLTPGPYNESYFEHAYLARYLGYTLAEGGDLTMRDNRVFLKLLGGLQPVDVILRRQDDDYCDPLELRPDSCLGVTGLVQAVRSGNVAVANALGSGLVDTPALLPFLPALCRTLLGEDLRLPSVPTYWCGDPVQRGMVLDRLDKLVIKPVFRSAGRDSKFGSCLSSKELNELAARIRANPRDYVAQEVLPLSTAPVWVDGALRPRPAVLRTYLTAAGETYAAMPGGLTRVSPDTDTCDVSIRKGGGSKDTWVLSSSPVNTFSLLQPVGRAIALSRGGGDLPSRVGDNLFWLGRYVERAENHVRLLRGILVRLTEKSGVAEVPELPTLLRALLNPALAEANTEEPDPQRFSEDRLLPYVFDTDRSESLAGTLGAVHRAAAGVRDRISTDSWRVISALTLGEPPSTPVPGLPMETEGGRTFSDLLDMLDRMVITLSAFGGMVGESMTRGFGWRFLDMGRRIERAVRMAGLLHATLTSPAPAGGESQLLEAVLEIADSHMTYRRRYLDAVQPAPVLDLLLTDESNPRSAAFQLAVLDGHVSNLPKDPDRAQRSEEERIMLSVLTELRLADVERLSRPDDDGRRRALDKLLKRLAGDLPRLSDSVAGSRLAHAVVSRHLSGIDGEER